MPSIAWLRNARSTSLADGYSTSCTAVGIELAELAREVERLAADPDVGADAQRRSRARATQPRERAAASAAHGDELASGRRAWRADRRGHRHVPLRARRCSPRCASCG